MRLLHKRTKQFHWINQPTQLRYNIISHKWYGTETSLQDFERQRDLPPAQWSAGVSKVMRACDQVEQYDEDYLWIDTCCIDKTSSAELQETLNSMFDWYRKAACCLVFMDDAATVDDLQHSLWWSRGWTLQELLAPQKLIFYSSQWTVLGTRDELASVVTQITGIDAECFGKLDIILKRPVAERMSWVSTRDTSRPEDIAYCMLGLFGINLPLLYGEGREKAFNRLQREIVHEIDDDTIFLWLPEGVKYGQSHLPILAPYPSDFKACLGKPIQLDTYFVRNTARMTRRGLELETCGKREDQFYDEQLLPLNCLVDGKRPVLELQRAMWTERQHNQWQRAYSAEWTLKDRNRYSAPREAYDKYRDQKMEFHQNNLPHGAPKHHNSSLQQLQFDREIISYNIFLL